MTTKERYYVNLGNYIETLLNQGKRSEHEDFQVLFRLFGEERVKKIAKGILFQQKLAEQKQVDSPPDPKQD